MSPEHSI